MSNSSWKRQLSENLKPVAGNLAHNTAIIGTGSELNGDDGVGLAIIRSLKKRIVSRPGLLLIEGSTLPESFSGTVRKFNPELVILVDAVDFAEDAGTIAFIDPNQVSGFSGSTHTLPLSMLAEYLKNELGCSVLLLGIQVKSLEFGNPLSDECRKAAQQVVTQISKIIDYKHYETTEFEMLSDFKEIG